MPPHRKAVKRWLLLDGKQPTDPNSTMKIHNSTYVFVLTVTALILTSGCRSTKPFTCVWQNPLDYAYDSLIYRDTITVKNIKAFTKHIDSLTENDVSQKFVIESIAEGKITQEIVTNSIVGHNNKIDTVLS